MTRQSKSPTPPLTWVTPFPRKRNTLPSSSRNFEFDPAVQGRNFEFAAKRRVSKGYRHFAVQMSTVTLKNWMGLHVDLHIQTPAGPPLGPASPSPDKRIRSPTSTPAGTFTDRVLCLSTRPAPAQALQGSAITSPRPRQRGQVCCNEKNPWDTRTCPAPLQSGQALAAVPVFAPEPPQSSQPASTGMRISTESALTACSRVNDML